MHECNTAKEYSKLKTTLWYVTAVYVLHISLRLSLINYLINADQLEAFYSFHKSELLIISQSHLKSGAPSTTAVPTTIWNSHARKNMRN